MRTLPLVLCLLFLISIVAAAQEVDITIQEGEVLKYDFQPGTVTTIKFSPKATLDFTYGPAFGSMKIAEITPKETKVIFSKNGGPKKTMIFKTGEKVEIDLLYTDLSEIDVTPTLVKNREGSQGVIMVFNSYRYRSATGDQLPESYSTLKKDTATTDPYLVGLILGIILLGIILLVVWKKSTKKEAQPAAATSVMTAARPLDEEKLYVAGTIEKAKAQPQIPPMSILKEDMTKTQPPQPTSIPHMGAKVESTKEPKKATKKAAAKKATKKHTK